MNNPTIAMLGLGAMGSRIAQNLINAGYPVVLYNRTIANAQPLIDQGAIFAATPKEAAAQANVIISMVTDDQASEAVWLDATQGAIHGMQPGQIAIESSTVTVDWVKTLAGKIEAYGASLVDAPVVGSRPQAEAGKLIYLLGGAPETIAQVQPILAASSAIQHSIGAIGQATAMKLAVNALFGIQVAALAEIIGMLSKQGLAAEAVMATLGELPIISPAAKLAGQLMLTQNYAPLFPIHLVAKDFRYASNAGQAVGAINPTIDAVTQVYQRAIEQGYGDQNITSVSQLFS